MVFKWLEKWGNDKSKIRSSDEGKDPLIDEKGGFVENAVALSAGVEMQEAYYPGHEPIDSYGNGGFRFGEMSHRGSLLFLPSGIHPWNITRPDQINEESFSRLFAEISEIEVLIIGTGKNLVPIDANLRQKFRESGIMADVMDSGAAVRTLNILLAEDRAAAAAIIAVE